MGLPVWDEAKLPSPLFIICYAEMATSERPRGVYGDVILAVDAWCELLRTNGFRDAVGTVSYYGWLPPIFGVVAHLLTQMFVVYVTEPFVIQADYIFPGWTGVFFVNLLYAFFLGGLIWFFFFGTTGAVAGLLASSRGLNTDVFKAGGYLAALFIPISIVSFALALTISAGDVGAASIEGTTAAEVAPKVMEVRMNIRATRQMRTVRFLRVIGWLTVAVLLRPMLEEFYDIGPVRSVAALVPSTMAVVLAAVLL